MNFASIPNGSSVSLDANVFVYSYSHDPTYGIVCSNLLLRIRNKDLLGYLSTSILNEVSHRLMTIEASQTFGWSYAGIAQRLRRNPAVFQKLHEFRNALDDIVSLGVQILPVVAQDILLGGDCSISYGLLSGDALLVALMQKHGLTHLASNDADFDRVPGIIRYSPL